MEENEVQNQALSVKKKRPFILRFLKALIVFILIVLIACSLWFVFSAFDRKASCQAIPPDYALLLRTDSAWDTLEPLLDVEALQILLSTPEYRSYRELYLQIKSSSLRQNSLVKKALQRRIDAALYDKGFVAVLDTGFLAGAARVAPYIIRLKFSDKFQLLKNQDSSQTYFKLNDTTYLAFHKNLIVVFSSPELESALSFNNKEKLSPASLEAMSRKLEEPLQIVADSQRLLGLLQGFSENPYAQAISQALSKDELALLNFGISDTDFNLKIELPFQLPDGENSLEENPILALLKKNSSVPSLLPKLPEELQYYTLLSAGSLEEIKNAAAKALPEDKHFEEKWKNAESFSSLMFQKSLEEILFSWTGDQFAVFGIEGKAEPVLAVKIEDEVKRAEIFDKIFSSIILQTNDSLLMDGVRLPCIEIPSFFQSILSMFGINLQMPYFLVKDDFIYFSQSPENLISLNYSIKRNTRLSKSQNWTRVSTKQSHESSLSLFYDLERSIPFFLSGKSTLSEILRLYNIGRMDLNVQDGKIILSLQAAAVENASRQNILGFPMKLDSKASSKLIMLEGKKEKSLFWLQEKGNICSLNLSSFEKNNRLYEGVKYILASKDNQKLWALTSEGLIYLLNSSLEVCDNFPLMTGLNITCPPVLYESSILFIDDEGKLCFVDEKAEVEVLASMASEKIRSEAAVLEDSIAFYEGGFFGGIHIYKHKDCLTLDAPLELEGLAYGSPCIFKEGKKLYYAMISQAGLLYIFDENLQYLQGFPLQLDGIFYVNVEYADGKLFALSSLGQLFSVSLDGQVNSIKIPYFSARAGNISLADYDGDKKTEIFVSGDGNILYGFTASLEMLYSFPLAAYGNPVFTDVNGDKKNDMLVITFDNMLAGYNVLR
ncbi:MAG: hypothetical protein K5681_00385 [Treponema sp.]|nr:hypothetical protein [Treponema sp.]